MGEIVRFGRGRQTRNKAPLLMMMSAMVAGAVVGCVLYEMPVQSVGETASFRLCAKAAQQSCVIDGDTIRYGGMTIRLADIDAPETREPKCASEAALGQRATQRLVELMNAGPFTLVRAGGRDEDVYQRKLRIIERDGRSVAATLVDEGLARPWDGARRSWCG